MIAKASLTSLISPGFDAEKANHLFSDMQTHAAKTWFDLQPLLRQHHVPFHVTLALFKQLHPTWPDVPAPAWQPDDTTLEKAPLMHFMKAHGLQSVEETHAYSVQENQVFWKDMLKTLNIQFKIPPTRIVDLSAGTASPQWLPESKLNIIDSCFNAPAEKIAILDDDGQHHVTRMTYGELNRLSNQIANGLVDAGFRPTDRIAIIMPMNRFAVAIYLGIVKMGGVVVSIADSFSSEEMSTRLDIAKAKAIFTQDQILRNNKAIPLYPKIKEASELKTIVLPYSETFMLPIVKGDCPWQQFLSLTDTFTSIKCDPMSAINILFSSGTTSTPKAIAWNHTTPIKVASDALCHQGIVPGDVLCWPTNLGWMMGPWLIFASFIREASVALFPDAPKSREFGDFVTRAGVTMLGVVPTLVSTWRLSRCMEGLDWSSIKAFSSTGECSNPEDMFYLMWLGGDKPIIEYCGGTEIGGAYLSSTLLQANYPSLFSTPAMGNRIAALNEMGQLNTLGELCLFPPAMGLSVQLENGDHHHVYFEGMPVIEGRQLRRHGDQLKQYANGYYSIQGRVDDTMNLGGIKVGAAEIERAIAGIPGIQETAAIAVVLNGQGRSELVIYATTTTDLNTADTQTLMQQKINAHLNPLFKIHELIFVRELPKTATNKIIRRALRDAYRKVEV